MTAAASSAYLPKRYKKTVREGRDVLQLGGVGRCAPHSHEHVGGLVLVRCPRLSHLSLEGNKVPDDESDQVRGHLDRGGEPEDCFETLRKIVTFCRRGKPVQQESGADWLRLLVVEIAHVAQHGKVFRRGDGYLQGGAAMGSHGRAHASWARGGGYLELSLGGWFVDAEKRAACISALELRGGNPGGVG
jgi:hypothetical protein